MIPKNINKSGTLSQKLPYFNPKVGTNPKITPKNTPKVGTVYQISNTNNIIIVQTIRTTKQITIIAYTINQ